MEAITWNCKTYSSRKDFDLTGFALWLLRDNNESIVITIDGEDYKVMIYPDQSGRGWTAVADYYEVECHSMLSRRHALEGLIEKIKEHVYENH